jgi:predicted RNA binding protein YcfA (HicA-like mRNA interferase family)
MPTIRPISRKELIRYLRRAGFDGPFSGGKHSFMIKGDLTLTVPNPHHNDIGVEFLFRILRQAGISRETWEHLD